MTISPTNRGETGAPDDEGSALCMSGGGYRAMVFHVGSLWRLYEAGLLKDLKRISSVSGGSITAGVLALAWPKLSFDPMRAGDDFAELVAGPVRALAGVTIDANAILGGVFWFGTVGDRIQAAYSKHLFGDATLQSLPDEPRFVINATNIQSGALWRFSKSYMGDYRVGLVDHPSVPLAEAVAASSAFPPVLSPVTLKLDPKQFRNVAGADVTGDAFRRKVILGDGGIYDNMGLETVWKNFRTVFVSDAGAKIAPEAAPHGDWARHALRVLDVVDNQVRSLRKRAMSAGYDAPAGDPDKRHGAYWSIRKPLNGFASSLSLPFDAEATALLAAIPTRLEKLNRGTQERLVNWGYLATDAALRAWYDASLPQPGRLPYEV